MKEKSTRKIANIITPDETFTGEIIFDQKIRSLQKISSQIDPHLTFLLPGFIDLHIHGGGGEDVMTTHNIGTILKTHLKNGTTSLLLTTVTSKEEDLIQVFQKIKQFQPLKTSPHILGIHLEGPYINREKLGAQPNKARSFSIDEIIKLNGLFPIKAITLAPEQMTEKNFKELHALSIKIQIGHSNGTYEDGVTALNQGAHSFTHLYNAMSPLHHRAPGIVGAALAHANYAELIPDLLHVHPGAIKTALRAIPSLYFVTDATSATGMPDGDFKLGTHHVTKCEHGVRLKDGTLAGSSLTMLDAFKNLIGPQISLTLSEASRRLSTIPSTYLGLESIRGEIKINTYADLIELDPSYNLINTWVDGVLVEN